LDPGVAEHDGFVSAAPRLKAMVRDVSAWASTLILESAGAQREALLQYDLEQLGPIGFQDLAAALVVQTFGAGVQVMGSGRDGGATCTTVAR
jgi:hypothetical protein